MKRFLLMGCAALATLTISAQEQVLKMPNMASTKSIVMTKPEMKPTKLNANMAKPNFEAKHIVPVATNGAAKAAPANMLPGYVEDYLEDDLHICDTVVVASANAQDEETGATYNVQLSFGEMGYVQNVYGNYDAAAGTLTIPSYQYCYEHATYGQFYIVGYKGNDYTDNLTFTLDEETGIFYLEEDGYIIGMADEEYASQGYYWLSTEGVSFLPKNGTFSFYYSGSDGWKSSECGVAVTDDGYTLGIYNALGVPFMYYGTYIESTYEGNEWSLATGQDLFPITLLAGSSVDTDTYGTTMHLGGCALNESAGTISRDATVTSLEGSKGTLETGESYAYSNDYFTIQSKEDADGAAYTMWCTYPTVIWTPYSATDGINEISANKEFAKTSSIYNLAGQVVDKAYKGIVIKNGKKYIQK